MWLELTALALFLGLVIATFAWRRTARLLALTTREREDLAKSALVIEIERQMLELVAKGASLTEVLDTLTHAIELLSPESLCTVMLLDEETRSRLQVASGPSLPPEYLQAANNLEIGPDVGACGTAAFRNETIVIEDISTDFRFASARDFVLSHGLRSCWSQPVRDSRNTVLGTFAIYRRYIATPRPEELRMARVAAQLAGNAIERIRAEKHLNETITRLKLAETVARFGIWEADFQKGLFALSAGMGAMMERPVTTFQLTKAEFDAMVHPEDRADLQAKMDPANSRAGIIQDEFRLVLPSGSVHWMRSRWSFELGDGQPKRATGAIIDISDEKEMVVEAEQEQAAAEESARVARQAERLEQDRKTILELVANDQPLDRIVEAMADAVAGHLPGSLCTIRIEDSEDARISIYPAFPGSLTAALERVDINNVNLTLASAPIENLSDDREWQEFIQTAADLPFRHYRAVSVLRSTRLTGNIISLLAHEGPDRVAEEKLLESWGRFASLAVERRGLYEQLSLRAQYDSLTGLLNRASLYERLASWIRADAPGQAPMAVIYLDLDSFKAVNDSYGHGAGDKVLQHVSAHILKSVRLSDIVARIGGDEFVIVLPGVSERSEASRIANNVVAAISRPLAFGGRDLSIGASFGVSVYPADGDNTDALLKIADENMYRVKIVHRDLYSRQTQSQKMGPVPPSTTEHVAA
jgi:diguanylate cyclase (GGDEF)-like protein